MFHRFLLNGYNRLDERGLLISCPMAIDILHPEYTKMETIPARVGGANFIVNRAVSLTRLTPRIARWRIRSVVRQAGSSNPFVARLV